MRLTFQLSSVVVRRRRVSLDGTYCILASSSSLGGSIWGRSEVVWSRIRKSSARSEETSKRRVAWTLECLE